MKDFAKLTVILLRWNENGALGNTGQSKYVIPSYKENKEQRIFTKF